MSLVLDIAFETLALASIKPESLTGPGHQHFAIINGNPYNPITPLKFPIATFTCSALDQTSFTLWIGSSRRTETAQRKPQKP